MTQEEIEAIAREVYAKDRFPNTDEVWCNLHWLSKFALAIEVHANSELIKDYAEWMSPEDYASLAEINVRLRTALERVRDEFDFCWDGGSPEPLRAIAKEALGNPPNFPF